MFREGDWSGLADQQAEAMMRKLIAILGVVVLAGCGSDSTGPESLSVAGGWSGTFETTTYTTTPILVDLVQVNSTVTGTWVATGGSVLPYGNINGTLSSSGSFAGTITYNYTGGPICSGSFSGTSTNSLIDWGSVGFVTGNCGLSSPGNPLGVNFVLQRRN